MALKASIGEITPKPIAAIFADTQSEPKSVYEYLSWLETQLSFPVYRVTAGSLWSKATNSLKKSCGIPAFILNEDGSQGIMSRQCTHDFKIVPVNRAITGLMRDHNTRKAIKWMGITTDEISRVKDSRRKTIIHRFPFIENPTSRYECLSWMNRNGFPEPPRSACIFCPYRRNSEWRRLSADEFNEAIKFEKELQVANSNGSLNGKPWLHRKMIPLSEVDFSTEEERGQLNMFNNECEGMCGV